MKLFLGSDGVGALPGFVGEARDRRVLFVPTAANPLPAEMRTFIERDRRKLVEFGFGVEELDLATTARGALERALERTDVLFVEGGTAFYLLEQVRSSGLADLLPSALDRRLLYVGMSGGAMILAPDLEPWLATTTEPAPASTRGLGLVDFLVLPHADTRAERYAPLLERPQGVELVPLRDDQAVLVEDGSRRVVASL